MPIDQNPQLRPVKPFFISAPRLLVGLFCAVLLSACGSGTAPAPSAPQNSAGAGSDPQAIPSQIQQILNDRCVSCHASGGTNYGVILNTAAGVRRAAARSNATIINRTMPPNNNVTGMTDAERALFGQWVSAGLPEVFGDSTAPPTTVPATPAAPASSAITASSVILSWSAVSSASYYQLLRGATIVNAKLTGLTYTDTGLSASTTYSYTLLACNSAGCSSASAATSVTTSAPAASAPAAPAAPTSSAPTATSVALSWSAVNTATYYQLLRGATTVNAKLTGLSYTDTGLSASTAYSYTLLACNSAGCSSASAATSVTTSAAAVGFSQIQSLVNTYCVACHQAGGQRSSSPLTTTANIVNYASQSNTLIQSGSMPRGGSLTDAQKKLFADWVLQGTSTAD